MKKTLFTVFTLALAAGAIEAQSSQFGCYKEVSLNTGNVVEQGCANVTVTAANPAAAAAQCKASGKCCVYPPSAGKATKAIAKQMGNLGNTASVACD